MDTNRINTTHVSQGINLTAYLLMITKRYFAHYKGLPSACWQRIGLEFVNDMAGGVCFFLSLYFVDVLHINIAVAGLIISSYGLGTAIGGITGGKLSDKISPSVVSIISLFIKAIVFLALIQLNTVPFLIMAEFLLGMTTYTFIVSNRVWVLNSCKNHEPIKLKTISMLYAASNLGAGISAIMVSILSNFGFHTIFFLSSLFLLIAAIILCVQEKKKVIMRDGYKRTSLDIVHPKEEYTRQKNNKKSIWLVLACLFSIGLIVAQLGTTYSIYITATYPKLGVNAVSILFALNTFFIVFFQVPIINHFSKYNKINMVGVGAFLTGCGMFILSYAFIFPLAILSVLIYTIGEMIFFTMAQLVIYQQSGGKKKGQSLGLFQTTYALSVIVGPTLGGYVYYHTGGYVLWHLSGLIGLSCLILCCAAKKYNISA